MMTDPRNPRRPVYPSHTERNPAPAQPHTGRSGLRCIERSHLFRLAEVPGSAVCPQCSTPVHVLNARPFLSIFIYEYRGVTVEVEAYETREGARARLDRFCAEPGVPKDENGEWDFSENDDHLGTVWPVELRPGLAVP